MPKFIARRKETSVRYYEVEIDAPTKDDAWDAAEGDGMLEWERIDNDGVEAEITEVVDVEEA